jgi:hypothetical protein
MDGEVETPGAEHLFTTGSNAPKVTKEVADLCHSLTVRLLFLSKRARPEIQTAVAFYVQGRRQLTRTITTSW